MPLVALTLALIMALGTVPHVVLADEADGAPVRAGVTASDDGAGGEGKVSPVPPVGVASPGDGPSSSAQGTVVENPLSLERQTGASLREELTAGGVHVESEPLRRAPAPTPQAVEVTDFASLKAAIEGKQPFVTLKGNDFEFTETLGIDYALTITAGEGFAPKFFRGDSFYGTLIKVSEQGSLYLGEDGTDVNLVFSGKGKNGAPQGASALIETAGKLVINGADFVDNTIGYVEVDSKKAPMIANGESASIVFNCGSIKNNRTHQQYTLNPNTWPFAPGAILLQDGAQMTMNGGSVSNNKALNWDASMAGDVGAISVEGGSSLTISGGDVTGNSGWDAGAIRVDGGSSLTISGGDVTGNSGQTAGAILAQGARAAVSITDGNIADNDAADWKGAGGIKVCNGAGLNMTGGTLSGNKGGIGGVLVGDVLYDQLNGKRKNMAADELRQIAGQRSNFTMQGGSIENNAGSYFAGGAMVSGNATFTMNAGSISGNANKDGGGGVLAYDWIIWEYAGSEAGGSDRPSISSSEWSEIFPAAFTMNGGTISNNKALGEKFKELGGFGDGDGGGLLVKSNEVRLNAGTFTGNSAGKHGGAIHVKTVPYRLNVTDVLIHDNGSDNEGGGIWICPIGDFEAKIQDGAVIYGNTAANAGDDFYSKEKHQDFFNVESKNHFSVILPERFPDGTKISWYSDDHGTRYKAGDAAVAPTVLENGEKGYKALVNAGDASTSNLKIFNNHAGDGGGGIGSNGYLEIGAPTEQNPPSYKDLKVVKEWDGTLTPSEVQIRLSINGREIETVTLNEANDFTATFRKLPAEINGTPIEDLISLEEVSERPDWVDFVVGENIEHGKVTVETWNENGGSYSERHQVLTVKTRNVVNDDKLVFVEGAKTWQDDGNKYGKRPDSIKITLRANGVDKQTIEVTQKDGWKWRFDNLPKYEDGKEILYSVAEEAVAGYVTEINGYNITNTWDGDTPDDPVKPTPEPTPKAPRTPATPATGDDGVSLAFGVALLGSAALLIGLLGRPREDS
ncbi:Cna B-type domain-containing protein [Tractidigestivibacter sp.]|uniref:Cna B-type domain-containing protein n=1 Tax=Tractidigestivibacter sp. TaxID=2847320 RepID=UPI002A9112C7|nr:Cna B-type domain-containing protein [Tractidigestivibacter sp.]MDY5271627.1 Cna B-type domain-containing protein [Tractidigestivibacter sp.]